MAVYGLKHGPQICRNTQNKFFLLFLDSWLPSIPKCSPLKVFSQVLLVLFTLVFEKLPVILL